MNGYPRLTVAWLALASLAWLPDAAMGQRPQWPGRSWEAFAPLLRGQQPDTESPFPPIGQDTLPPPQSGPPDKAAEAFGSDANGMQQRGPGYEGAFEDPAFGGDTGCGQPADQPLPPRYRYFGRHCGRGQPLINESWLYRPLSVGWSMGIVQGSPVTSDWAAGQQQGFFGAVRFGWDHTYHWGSEMRFSFDSMNAKAFQWDLDLLYYPWGDSRWRPYLMAGFGAAKIHLRRGFSPRYDGGLTAHYSETVVVLPLAIGAKYRVNDWMALRLEVGDNILFGAGSDLNTLVNLTITGGFEFRFGGRRKSYWPWNPGRHYW